VGGILKACAFQGLGEGLRGASLTCSSKGGLGEASQSEDNVAEMEEVMGLPWLEILNSLSTPFSARRERQLAWGRALGNRVSFSRVSLVL